MTRTEETTFLDPPITPAPIFAYRALKGLIFGSPDPNSSPERVLQHNNKENISPQRLGTIAEDVEKGNYTPKATPQKRKRSTDIVALSPTKGLMVPVSTTKGILRTPGVATPRAKALRDVNVKFRSLSPELRRKEVKHEIVLEDVGAKRQKTQRDDTKATTTRAISETTVQKDVQGMHVALPRPKSTPAAANSDFEGYQRRTEKEMKMLIRQGRKWRDYARIQDEENIKLKQLLEQAQRENERLERKLRLTEKARSTSNAIVLDPMEDEMRRHFPLLIDKFRGRTAAQTTKELIAPNPVEGEETRTKSTKTDHPPVAPFASNSMSESLQARLAQLRQSSAPSLTSHALPSRPSRPSFSVIPATAQKAGHLTADKATAKTPAAPSPLTALAQKLEPEPSPHTSARTNLAPERYSAARQRIRQKQQARKVSRLSHVAEESNIDWIGLG